MALVAHARQRSGSIDVSALFHGSGGRASLQAAGRLAHPTQSPGTAEAKPTNSTAAPAFWHTRKLLHQPVKTKRAEPWHGPCAGACGRAASQRRRRWRRRWTRGSPPWTCASGAPSMRRQSSAPRTCGSRCSRFAGSGTLVDVLWRSPFAAGDASSRAPAGAVLWLQWRYSSCVFAPPAAEVSSPAARSATSGSCRSCGRTSSSCRPRQPAAPALPRRRCRGCAASARATCPRLLRAQVTSGCRHLHAVICNACCGLLSKGRSRIPSRMCVLRSRQLDAAGRRRRRGPAGAAAGAAGAVHQLHGDHHLPDGRVRFHPHALAAF